MSYVTKQIIKKNERGRKKMQRRKDEKMQTTETAEELFPSEFSCILKWKLQSQVKAFSLRKVSFTNLCCVLQTLETRLTLTKSVKKSAESTA